MKFLTVFAAILAVAVSSNSHWTLHQLSEALESPHTNPSLVPLLQQAMNEYMQALFAGENHQSISITTAPVDLSTWTLAELSEAIQNPNTNPAILPYLENGLDTLMSAIFAGEVQGTTAQVAIVIPSLEVSYWSLLDLEKALWDPTTNPAMIPYLEQAINHIVKNLFSGVQQTFIVLAIPAEITSPIAVAPVVVAPEVTVDPVQVVDQAVNPSPVAVGPVSIVDSGSVAPLSGSPLVQIIVNINQQSTEAVITPSPVDVVDNTPAFQNPRPPVPEDFVAPAEEAAFENPRPPAPVVIPEPVIVVPDYNPIDVIAVSPEIIPEPVVDPDYNPIDVIAVSPEIIPEPVIVVPDYNPIDVIAVSPEIIPEPVVNPDYNPIDVIAVSPEIIPEPVIVNPDYNPIDVIAVSPEIIPEPVVVVPDHNPIDVVAVYPGIINPIDTVAVAPPEFNPVDLLHPIQPVAVVDADFGPM